MLLNTSTLPWLFVLGRKPCQVLYLLTDVFKGLLVEHNTGWCYHCNSRRITTTTCALQVRLSIKAALDTSGQIQPPPVNASILVTTPNGTVKEPIVGSLMGENLLASYEIFLTEPKDATINTSPNITLSHFAMVTADTISFQV